MSEKKRDYHSPLRARRREDTRRLILESVAALITEGRIHTFTMQDVAERAGISYASVYRHFDNREALLEAIYDWVSEVAGPKMPPSPRALEEIPGWIEASIHVFEEHAEAGQAVVMVMAALNIDPASRRERDRAIEDLVQRDAPRLSTEEARRAAAVVRLLAGAQSWATLRRRFGLEAGDAAAALSWALGALIRDLKRAD
jgi:AcrR family transcriptional regulator